MYTHIPIETLIDKVDQGDTAIIRMTGGDYHLPGPPGYEWVMRAQIGTVELTEASSLTTDNWPEEPRKRGGTRSPEGICPTISP